MNSILNIILLFPENDAKVMEQAHMYLLLDQLNTKYYIIISLDGRQVLEQAQMNL
jgi:hypothetical protein